MVEPVKQENRKKQFSYIILQLLQHFIPLLSVMKLQV